jgi:L-iditol 2-dehydrogenase
MIEPVNTVLKAINRLRLLPGDNVLVVGQGPIGLLFTRLLALRGMNVVATDLLPARLKMARQFGAKYTFQSANDRAEPSAPPADAKERGLQSVSAQAPRQGGKRTEVRAPNRCGSAAALWSQSGSIHACVGKQGLTAAIITAPSDAAVVEAQQLLNGAGQLLLFAHTRRGSLVPLDLAAVCVDEKDFIGSYSSDFTLQREVARLVFLRRLDVRPLVTHRFPLDRAADAIALAARPVPNALKIVVTALHT